MLKYHICVVQGKTITAELEDASKHLRKTWAIIPSRHLCKLTCTYKWLANFVLCPEFIHMIFSFQSGIKLPEY